MIFKTLKMFRESKPKKGRDTWQSDLAIWGRQKFGDGILYEPQRVYRDVLIRNLEDLMRYEEEQGRPLRERVWMTEALIQVSKAGSLDIYDISLVYGVRCALDAAKKEGWL